MLGIMPIETVLLLKEIQFEFIGLFYEFFCFQSCSRSKGRGPGSDASRFYNCSLLLGMPSMPESTKSGTSNFSSEVENRLCLKVSFTDHCINDISVAYKNSKYRWIYDMSRDFGRTCTETCVQSMKIIITHSSIANQNQNQNV